MVAWKVQSWEPYLKPDSTKKCVKDACLCILSLAAIQFCQHLCSWWKWCWNCHMCLTVQSLKLLGLHFVFEVIALISSFIDWKRYKFHDLLGYEVSWYSALTYCNISSKLYLYVWVPISVCILGCCRQIALCRWMVSFMQCVIWSMLKIKLLVHDVLPVQKYFHHHLFYWLLLLEFVAVCNGWNFHMKICYELYDW